MGPSDELKLPSAAGRLQEVDGLQGANQSILQISRSIAGQGNRQSYYVTCTVAMPNGRQGNAGHVGSVQGTSSWSVSADQFWYVSV
jgi:hypothetical protein